MSGLTTRLRVATAAVALMGTAACYPIWSGNALEDRMAALENASMENRAQLDDLRRDWGSRLDRLEESLEKLTRSATKTTAEVAASQEELLRQVQLLRGELAEAQFRAESFDKRFTDLEGRVVALGGDEAMRKYEARKGLAQIERPTDKDAFFDLAKSYLDRKEYDVSRTLFGEFITKWRFDEKAPLAQVLIGDSYFDQKQYRAAVLEYQKVRENWPRSRYLPDALYKLGLSFLQLGLRDEARAFLEEAAKYPGQEAGKKAQAKLRELQGNRKR